MNISVGSRALVFSCLHYDTLRLKPDLERRRARSGQKWPEVARNGQKLPEWNNKKKNKEKARNGAQK